MRKNSSAQRGRRAAELPTSAAASRVESGTISADRFRLRYRIEGSGLACLVIGSSVYYPRVFSQEMRRHLRMVFLDQRVFALTPHRGKVPVSGLNEILEDVERARRQLDLSSVVVVGHSGHALMALEYAKRYPKHVSHVVMISIGPSLSPEHMAEAARYWRESVDPERKAVHEENVRNWPAKGADQGLISWYLHNVPRIWFDPHFDPAPLWEGVEVNQSIFDRVWGTELRDIDISRGLEALDRPVFLALGRYDFIIPPPASWDALRPKFRDLTVRVFERSGHTPPFEQPELFDRELMAWLKSRPTR